MDDTAEEFYDAVESLSQTLSPVVVVEASDTPVETPIDSVSPIVTSPQSINQQAIGDLSPAADEGGPKATTPLALSDDQPQTLNALQQTSTNETDIIMVKNLDNGLTVTADQLYEEYRQRGGVVNPLSYQIYKRTGVMNDSSSALNSASDESDTETTDGKHHSSRVGYALAYIHPSNSLSRTKAFLKNMKQKVSSAFLDLQRSPDEGSDAYGDYGIDSSFLRVRGKKGNRQFTRLSLVQELIHLNNDDMKVATHTKQSSVENLVANAIWVMRFNRNGKYLAAGGQDTVVRIWALLSETLADSNTVEKSSIAECARKLPEVFNPKVHREFRGHKADILDLAWSKNDFLLSSSMDKTVRLWHVSRMECLCCFQHSDFVTSVSFHPRDDRFFLSGCLDCRIRLWSIPEKKVSFWNELPNKNMITAVGFTADGKIAMAGSYIGTCVFYQTEGLTYNTQIHVRSTRGKNSKGEKITRIEPMPDVDGGVDIVLITSNDSRLRIYNIRDKSLYCKFKGLTNGSSQIGASFSDDAQFIISGSEDNHAYIWKLNQPTPSSAASEKSQPTSAVGTPILKSPSSFNFSTLTHTRRDRDSAYESFQAHDTICTCAVFAPKEASKFLEMAGLRFSTNVTITNEPSSPTEPSRDRTLSDMVTASPQMSKSQIILNVLTDSDLNSRSRSKSSDARPRSTQKSPSLSRTASIRSVASRMREPRPSDGRIIVTADYRGTIRVFENERPNRSYYGIANMMSSENGSKSSLPSASSLEAVDDNTNASDSKIKVSVHGFDSLAVSRTPLK